MSQQIEYKRPDGGTASGFYAEPATANAPGIVVIQEWWGLNDQIKRVGQQWTEVSLGWPVSTDDTLLGRP